MTSAYFAPLFPLLNWNSTGIQWFEKLDHEIEIFSNDHLRRQFKNGNVVGEQLVTSFEKLLIRLIGASE